MIALPIVGFPAARRCDGTETAERAETGPPSDEPYGPGH